MKATSMNDRTPGQEHTLYIRNMVCNRCILVVRTELEKLGLHPLSVELGIVLLPELPAEETLEAVRTRLEALGFGLIDDRRAQCVERIKNTVVELVHYRNHALKVNLSDYLAGKLGRDYDSLSRLFSEAAGSTIEKYFILQKVERAKELLVYGELTLSEIADQLNYSSAAYFSAQFKSVTGLTPGKFRSLRENRRKPLDEL